MKSYSLDGERRFQIWWAFLAVSFAITSALFASLKYVPFLENIIELDESIFGYLKFAISAIPFIFPTIYFLFNKYIWRWPLVNSWVQVPDLNGTWIGTIDRQEYPSGNHEKGVAVFFQITQKYFTMSARLINKEEDTLSKRTESEAVVIGISGNQDSGFFLDFMFEFDGAEGKIFGANMLKLDVDGKYPVLSGKYVSNFPRKGNVSVQRLLAEQHLYWGKIEQFESRSGEAYFGISVPQNAIKKYADDLKGLLGPVNYTTLSTNRIARDGASYHLTVITPIEYEKLSEEARISIINNDKVFYVLSGLGTQSRRDCQTYYVTVRSPHCAYRRIQNGLPDKDLHVTLGFDPCDIYDAPKGEATWL